MINFSRQFRFQFNSASTIFVVSLSVPNSLTSSKFLTNFNFYISCKSMLSKSMISSSGKFFWKSETTFWICSDVSLLEALLSATTENWQLSSSSSFGRVTKSFNRERISTFIRSTFSVDLLTSFKVRQSMESGGSCKATTGNKTS